MKGSIRLSGLMLALAVVMAWAWAWLAFLPARSTTQDAIDRMETTNADREFVTGERIRVQQFEAERPLHDDRFAAIELAIPSTVEFGNFARRVHSMADESSFDVTVVTPDVVTAEATFATDNEPPVGVAAVAVSISGIGSYSEINNFVATLETSDRLVVVDTLSIAVMEEDPDVLSLDLVARIFTTEELVAPDPADDFDEEAEGEE
ncbi:MAG: Tfp pilus assembly protein PilO [Acidimicrobiales bacterium]|jgi:Tfp pilus assembly protein PilO